MENTTDKTVVGLEQKAPNDTGKNTSLKVSNEEHKAKRKRKRHHFNAIRAQMEFYFGDANLSKDRFLKQTIDKDPYVPLELFFTFNKIKVLTKSVEEIARSLSNSELLELDETQLRVRRKTPLPKLQNVDEKTLYVEGLPSSADHEWVRQVFELFGPVTYVSLPKYFKSRKIKEFGFVEFEKERSVEKAIKAFQEFNGVLSIQETSPEELKSIKTFIKEENGEELTEETSKSVAEKRQKLVRDEDDSETPKAKRSKITDEAESVVPNEPGISSESCTADESATENDNKEITEDSTSKKKLRRRKKKKKSKIAEKRKIISDTSFEATFYDLKILPKRDWKRLRNKYLNLQREKIGALKRKDWKERKQAEKQSMENILEDTETTAAPPLKKLKPSERKLHKMNMNFYGAGDDDSQTKIAAKEVNQNPAQERAPLFNYEPGLIVQVNFLEPCVNVVEFKAEMRQYSTVKYVDVKEGAIYAHLRLESAAAAEKFVEQIACAEYRCSILSDNLEKEYWKKIEHDREMKLNKQFKVLHKRGREKVKKLISKHIRFGDENEE